MTGICLQVVLTGELVEVVAWEPGQPALVRREDDTLLVLDPDEPVRVIPPTWSLKPSAG